MDVFQLTQLNDELETLAEIFPDFFRIRSLPISHADIEKTQYLSLRMITDAKLSAQGGEIIRGKYFSTEDLRLIQQLTLHHFEEGRTKASIEICRALNWRQPNGWLKDRACRDVLRVLEAKGYLNLPAVKSNPVGNQRRSASAYDLSDKLDRKVVDLLDFNSIELTQVKGTPEEALWNWVVETYHYLGFSVLVGRALKYLIRSNGRIIGAWSLSDCAWSLQARDSLLKKFGFELEDIRFRVVNNSRFLILPWIKVPNLASRLLALAVPRSKLDWRHYYSVEPVMLETFVEANLFRGTCYKAGNWMYIGRTKGYRKAGCLHHNSQTSKSIFVYPLSRRLRKKLVGVLSKCPI